MSVDPHAHLKEKKLQKLRGRAAGAVITVSDRCKNGERPDKSGPLAQELLGKYGIIVDRVRVVSDGIESVQNEIRAAIAEGARVVITTGGTGITERDLTPEATGPLLEARLDGIAWQICQQGLKATPLASLSRPGGNYRSRRQGCDRGQCARFARWSARHPECPRPVIASPFRAARSRSLPPGLDS